MERSVLLAVTTGAVLALGILLVKSRPATVATIELEAAPISADEPADPTAGWITVHEPQAKWNLSDSDVIHFICPRPEWYPYHTFLGPPVPESSTGLDPAGYVMRTAQGVRLHRDGWVVTADGRAYRAEGLNDPVL